MQWRGRWAFACVACRAPSLTTRLFSRRLPPRYHLCCFLSFSPLFQGFWELPAACLARKPVVVILCVAAEWRTSRAALVA